MNKQEDYKSKYLKYKTKYLNLLNQSGGFCNEVTSKNNQVLCYRVQELYEENKNIMKNFPDKIKDYKCDLLNCRSYTYNISKLKSLVNNIQIEIDKLNSWKYRGDLEDIKGIVQDNLEKLIKIQKVCKCNTWI
jgi:hypothetical protein